MPSFYMFVTNPFVMLSRISKKTSEPEPASARRTKWNSNSNLNYLEFWLDPSTELFPVTFTTGPGLFIRGGWAPIYQ